MGANNPSAFYYRVERPYFSKRKAGNSKMIKGEKVDQETSNLRESGMN